MTTNDFEKYVASRWAGLVRAACMFGCSLPEAEDLVQTTLASCFVRWGRVSAADDVDRYVGRMLLNQLRTSKRRRWWSEHPSLDVDLDRDAGVEEDLDGSLVVRAAVGRLGAVHREVVVARLVLDLSESQTADLLGIPRGTVKSRLSRALGLLAGDRDLLAMERN